MKKVLKPEYRDIVEDFEVNYDSCTCHICPPCNHCTHEGNPLNLEETPDAWNIEFSYDKLICREVWVFLCLTQAEGCFTIPVQAKRHHINRSYKQSCYPRLYDCS